MAVFHRLEPSNSAHCVSLFLRMLLLSGVRLGLMIERALSREAMPPLVFESL